VRDEWTTAVHDVVAVVHHFEESCSDCLNCFVFTFIVVFAIEGFCLWWCLEAFHLPQEFLSVCCSAIRSWIALQFASKSFLIGPSKGAMNNGDVTECFPDRPTQVVGWQLAWFLFVFQSDTGNKVDSMNVIFVDHWDDFLNEGVLVFFVVGFCSLLIDLLLSFFGCDLCCTVLCV
jgi:hypothetical protein